MDVRHQPITILPNSYKLYINYNILKTLLNKDSYDNISDYTLLLIDKILQNYPEFELHMDLNCSPYADSSTADRYTYHSKKVSPQLLNDLFNDY